MRLRWIRLEFRLLVIHRDAHRHDAVLRAPREVPRRADLPVVRRVRRFHVVEIQPRGVVRDALPGDARTTTPSISSISTSTPLLIQNPNFLRTTSSGISTCAATCAAVNRCLSVKQYL